MTSDPTQLPQLPEPVMPTLQRAFSRNVGCFQFLARLAIASGLLFIAASAIVSIFHNQSVQIMIGTYHVNGATAIAAILFLAAGASRVYRIYRDPERVWFGSRALAERTRSLAWRFAVAGEPFPRPGSGPDNPDADARFRQALNDAADEAGGGGIDYHMPRGTEQISVITDWMHDTRALNLDARRALYAKQRIKNQEEFYTGHERKKRRAATLFQWILLLIEIGGAVLAALNALALLNLDLIGVTGTVAAGVAAWVQFNKYTELADTYGAMAYRMASFREQCLSKAQPWNEDRWATFVGRVEDALREENGAWRHIVQQGTSGQP